MDLTKLKIYSPGDFPAYLPKLNRLYDDLFHGGKGFRSSLVKKIGQAIDVPDKTIHLLGQTIEFIHNASLLHDDLIDRSELRRNKTTAWLKYSPEYSVLAGDYLLARVMVNLSTFGNVELIKYTSEMISDLLEGEWIQDSLVGDPNVELSQLDQVHLLKTSSLFKWCLVAPFMAMASESKSAQSLLSEMGVILGRLFQRSDDLLDFDIRNKENKAVLGDLKSGYINSFSAYLLQNESRLQGKDLMECKTMEEVYNYVGRDRFSQILELFDVENKELIELYEHYTNQLFDILPATQVNNLDSVLRPLPHILYWREVVKN